MENKINKKNEIKTFSVFGYKIVSNLCTALNYNIYLKKFGEHVKHSGAEHGFELTMNHIRVHELLNEATSIEIKKEDETNDVYLLVETDEYRVSFKIPCEEQA